MRIFAQKQKPTQQAKSINSMSHQRKFFTQNHVVRSILYLQRTIGNHAVQRLLQTKSPKAKREFSFQSPKADSFQSSSSLIDHILFLQKTIGNQAVARLIQAKLTVGKPGDQFEQEADRVAEKVINMPNPVVHRQPQEEELRRQPAEKEELQRQTPKEEEEIAQRQPVEEEEETISTHANPGKKPMATSGVQDNINQMRGGAQPLPRPVRAFFEPRFGRDFSDVRVHTDSKAAETANAVSARAFTLGTDVLFGAGEYSPETTQGKKLLAHELAHVVQQNNESNQDPENPVNDIATAHLLHIKCNTPLMIARSSADDLRKALLEGSEQSGGPSDITALRILRELSLFELLKTLEELYNFYNNAFNELLVNLSEDWEPQIVLPIRVIQFAMGDYILTESESTGFEPMLLSLLPYEQDEIKHLLPPLSKEPEKRRQEVEPTKQSQADTNWSARVKNATSNEDYVSLLIYAVGVSHEVHVAEKPIDEKTKAPSDAKPDVINFVPSLSGRSGQTVPIYIPAERKGTLPQPMLLIGRGPFKSSSRAFLQATVAHEEKHVSHLKKTIGLIEQWRESKSNNFRDWLWDQFQAKEISEEIYYVARNRTEESTQGETTVVTEGFSYLAGFEHGYDKIPQEDYKSNPDHEMLLVLDQIADYWVDFDSNPLQEDFIKQLEDYYQNLSVDEYKHIFDNFVKRQHSRRLDREEQRQAEFFSRLKEFAAEKR